MNASELKEAILELQMILKDPDDEIPVELRMANGHVGRASECVLAVRDGEIVLSIRARENR